MVFHKVFLWFIPLGFYGGWTIGGIWTAITSAIFWAVIAYVTRAKL
jgi:hypothetical protein